MTPKEKADELVDKLLESLYDNGSLSFKRILYHKAKQCALIAVDEVLDCLNINHDNVYFYNPEYEYYKEVKKEIEEL